MMMSKSIFLVVSLFLIPATLSAAPRECQHPPSLWCSSPEISKACQVTEQCASYMRTSGAVDKVNFVLYFESLCPDCQRFMRTQLWPAYNAVGNIMNITLVPYGNAHEKKSAVEDKWKFECQHGEQECIGNLIETCAIAVIKNITVYFPFIHCMELSTEQSHQPQRAAEKCAEELKIQSLSSIMSCSQGSMGNQLEHQMALQTEALNPPHKYVPWVTINGVHTEEMEKQAEGNLIKLICDTYKGPKPDACSQITYSRCQKKEEQSNTLKWIPLVDAQ